MASSIISCESMYDSNKIDTYDKRESDTDG